MPPGRAPFSPDWPGRVEKKRIPGGGGAPMDILICSPPSNGNLPCLVYFHGGGFVLRGAAYHYALVGAYALQTPCKVVWADYRLAPRHPFPAAAEDCYAALCWAAEHGGCAGIDGSRLAVGGDSAGGNLAAAAALMARDRRGPALRRQMLLYPVLDRRMKTASMQRGCDTPVWNRGMTEKMWRWYLPAGEIPDVQYASPPEADCLTGLPDAYIEAADVDCLRDEALEYAAALRAAGVGVELHRPRGSIHAFDRELDSALVQDCIKRRAASLRRAFYR